MSETEPKKEPFHLSTLSDICECLSPVECAYWAEGCGVALENAKHTSPVDLSIAGAHEENVSIAWKQVKKSGSWKNPIDSAHFGGLAIAVLVIKRATPYKFIEQSFGGTGIDYYVGDDVGPNFIKARLEISGIGEEKGSNTVARRLATKTAQSKRSDDSGMPAYVVVTEFKGPSATITHRLL